MQCDGTTITFDAYNTFKQMNTFPGTYTITAAVGDDDDGTVTGDFFGELSLLERERDEGADAPQRATLVRRRAGQG